MYFILKNNIEYDSPFWIKEPKGLPIGFDLISGEEMNEAVDLPLVYTTNAKKGDTLRSFLDCSYTIMTIEFLELIKKAGATNFQTFPVIIKSIEDGHIWENYIGVNVLGVVSCADLSKSVYSELMPGAYLFESLAIDTSKIPPNLLIFRLEEDMALIIIHKKIGKTIAENDPDFEKYTGWDVGEIIQD